MPIVWFCLSSSSVGRLGLQKMLVFLTDWNNLGRRLFLSKQ